MSDSTLESEIRSLVRSAWKEGARFVEARPLAGDASSRRYYRVTLAGAPRPTAVLMKQSGSGLSISSDELSSIPEAPKEMPFLNVQRYLGRIGIAVPEVYAADSERGLALLEDIGDTTLWDAAEGASQGGISSLFRSAIDELVTLQRGGEERPDAECIAFRQRFDSRLFLWEFDHFLDYGFAGRNLTGEDRAALRAEFEELAAELASGPQVLAHRDYHSWNLFVQDRRLRVIDFQDALLAPLPYDLATLLNDRATPTRVTPELERALVGYFCERRTALGSTLDPAAFLPRYFRFVLQKSFKIIGRFHYLENVKGKRGYVAMLPHTFATVRRCFENLPDLDALRARLAKSFAELA